MVRNDRILAELEDNDRFRESSFVGSESASPQDVQDDDEDHMPETMIIRLNFRRGQANPISHTKVKLRSIKKWPPKEFIHRRDDGYNIFLARINDFIGDIRAMTEFKGVRWSDGAVPYIKPNRSARQDKFSPIREEDFQRQLFRAWRSEVSYVKSHNETTPVTVEVFAYLTDTAGKHSQTVQNQSQNGLEEANRRINAARAAGTMDFGPVMQMLFARQLVSRPGDHIDEPIAPPPNNPLYTQARQLDERMAEQPPRVAVTQRARDLASVKVFTPGRRDNWIELEIDVTDIRRALGFDLVKIGKTTRNLIPPPVPRSDTYVPDIHYE